MQIQINQILTVVIARPVWRSLPVWVMTRRLEAALARRFPQQMGLVASCIIARPACAILGQLPPDAAWFGEVAGFSTAEMLDRSKYSM
jgi:hypothetical protein